MRNRAEWRKAAWRSVHSGEALAKWVDTYVGVRRLQPSAMCLRVRVNTN